MARKRHTFETREEAILRAATRLFAKDGFRGTTTKEIARAAGINEALLYRHFATKNDLYSALLKQKLAVATEALPYDAAKKKDDFKVFFEIAMFFVKVIRNDPDFLKLMFYSALEGHKFSSNFLKRNNLPIAIFLLPYFEERVKDGVFRDIDPELGIRAFVGMVHHYLITNMIMKPKGFKKFKDEEAVKVFVEIFLRGIRR